VKKSVKKWIRIAFIAASVWLASARPAGVPQAEFPARSSVEFSLRFKWESTAQPAPSVRKAAPIKNKKPSALATFARGKDPVRRTANVRASVIRTPALFCCPGAGEKVLDIHDGVRILFSWSRVRVKAVGALIVCLFFS